ncbi:MAG: winged helix-turn-helix domain-containing protein [Acidobacteriia bacterium]|nr:winged helix-turn-helix domain-containing protein [Terriglobia bacterium]
MSNQQKELYEFGPFRLDPGKRLLLRDNQPVPLQLKAFETLLVLVRNSEQVVLKDDLMKAVWPNTFVEESNLAQNIFVLRKTLGAMVGEQRYIVTIPGRGYTFASKVRVICEEESLVVESHSRTRVVIDEKSFPDVTNAAVRKETTTRSTRRKVVLASAILALTVAAVAFRPMVPPPKVIRFRQLTHLGTLVHNTKLVTDGPRIYFRVWDGKERVVRYVSTEGGEVFPLDKAIPNMDIDDISPSGSEFLEVNLGDLRRLLNEEAPYPSLWRVPVPSGSPQPVGDVRSRDARWSPDGSTIAYSVGPDLNLVNSDGSNPRKLATLPGEPFYPIWSPDGKHLRFSVADPRIGTALWQADLPSGTVHPLLPDRTRSDRPWAGGWTPDGKYFFYTALGDWATRNILAIREDEMLRRVNPQPIQITAGPLTFYLPTPSKDGKSVFAVGEQFRGQLVRYDTATQQFVPYAQGISADHVTYSRDGQWMAYVEFPEGVLVRSRVDGTERRQLTFPPMLAFSPQWSPDGAQLAFQAKARLGARNKIYLISSSGGVPSLATPDRQDQQVYPSWTSDGSSILFSGSDESGSNLALYSLDLNTKHVSQLPGTADFYWGQISPDGRHVVALENITQKLLLYDTASHQTRTLAGSSDYPRWSADGQYVYFSTIYWSPHGKEGGVYRWNISTNTTELVTRYPEFLLAGAYGVCYGITPDGSTLLVRDVSTRDLYALDMELP